MKSPIGRTCSCCKSWLPFLVLLLCGLIVITPTDAATLTVYTNADNGAGSLRQAINDASAGDTINISVTGTIALTSAGLTINKNLIINGPGARRLTVARSSAVGTPTFRVITNLNVTLTINGLTISNGSVAGGEGAGIRNAGTLTLNDCAITNNHSGVGGGSGGGVFNDFRLTMNRCTVSGNTAGEGAGIASRSVMVLKNCTIANNTASSATTTARGGGGILNTAGGNAGTIHGCTITTNSAATQKNGAGGGGIASTGGIVHVGNSIIAENSTTAVGADVNGTFTSDGHNFIGKGNGGNGFGVTGDQVGTSGSPLNPSLGPLQDNGGPGDTRRPTTTSLVLDQGKSLGLTTDQRGHQRPYNGSTPNAVNGDGSDIGAFELSPRFLEVTTTADGGPGSLRQAIYDAGSDDSVGFAWHLRGSTITLTSGELLISRELTIYGHGAHLIKVQRSQASGTPEFRIFHVTGRNVRIQGLTISNGVALGGGLYNDEGTLTIDACTFSGNKSYGSSGSQRTGGGICNSGTLTLTNSTLMNNDAGTLTGGGLYNEGGAATVRNCTFASNDAGTGGGVFNTSSSNMTMTNTTIYANRANSGSGGGVANNGSTLSLDSCTISNNGGNSSSSTNGGGGIRNFSTGVISIRNTIVADNAHNQTGRDVFGDFNSGGYNLIARREGSTGFTATGDQTGTIAAPRFARLKLPADNGGPTLTMYPEPDSPVIDKGNTPLTTDQRGHQRPYNTPGVTDPGNSTDIGAVEADVFSGTIQFSAANFTVNEATTLATFTLTRSGSTAGTARVDYYTWNGTAKMGDFASGDYVGVSGPVYFNPGETTKTAQVQIINTAACEPIESLNIGLWSPPGGSPLGTIDTATITIYDDDCNYTISGRVANHSGAGMANVQITRTGGSNAVTNSGGYYTFTGVKQGNYTIAPLITPGLTGVTFFPLNYNVTVNTSNHSNINFTASYTVTGKVTNSSGTGIANIQVTRKAGASSVTAVTNSSGTYTFSGVRSGSYIIAPVVTPAMTGTSFFPTSKTVSVNTSNLTNINFSAFFSISGKITNSSGVGMGNVLVTRTAGSSSTSVVTDSSGTYTFSGVRSGTYTIKPSQSGRTFSPTTRSVTVGTANLTNINFIGS